MVKLFGHNHDYVDVLYNTRFNYYYLITINYEGSLSIKTIHTFSANKRYSEKYEFSFDEFDYRKTIGGTDNDRELKSIIDSIEESDEKNNLLKLLES